MKSPDSTSIQTVISYTAFVLSGFLIFSPIHKSQNLPLSLLCAAAVSFLLLLLILRIFMPSKKTVKKPKSCRISAISASLFSLFAVLMLLTEIIKDTAYIANRGVNLFYYTSTAIAVLLVSFALCIGRAKGIFRFCILSIIPFGILLFTIFFALFTTKGIITDISPDKGFELSSIITGLRSGIFYAIDTSVFLFAFKEQIFKEDNFQKKQIFLGYLISYSFIFIYNIFTVLIFGNLTSKISDPDYALIKLIRGFDLTEIITAVRIVSFLIKSSVYIYLSSKCISEAFPKPKEKAVTAGLYILIPVTFLFLSAFDKSLEYGAFQHLIYPVTAILSILFAVIYSITKKREP